MGRPSGSAKKVNSAPVNGSTRTGSAATPCAARARRLASMSATRRARWRRPQASGYDGRAGEFILDKHRYSAFIGTRLDQLLRSNGVQTIVVCGVATTGCVESTIRDGFMLDYYVVIARDACGDYEAARHTNALNKLDLSFGTVVSVADIEQRWSVPAASGGAGAVRDRAATNA